ncbi:MAG: methyltransferase domain-containing protein [Bryobacteraceae bacterium]|nr:methyltransferase domain-containing protein [Bryobacteraceae bacterium]
MFDELERISERPEPFEHYTASELWTNEHTSAQMLKLHLDEAGDMASRNGGFIGRSVEWIARRFKAGEGAAIADFGCGPGLYSNRLAMLGARVTGIDFSKRAIEFAGRAAAAGRLSVDYHTCNYLEFETDERFDAVLMIMCDYCALSPRQRRLMLGRFAAMLKPGGAVLLDVYSPAAFDRRTEQWGCEAVEWGGFWSPERHFVFQNTFKYVAEKVVLDKYTIVERTGVKRVYNWFQHFSPDELGREMLEAGLEIAEIHGDVAGGDYEPESSEFAVIAVKRRSSPAGA